MNINQTINAICGGGGVHSLRVHDHLLLLWASWEILYLVFVSMLHEIYKWLCLKHNIQFLLLTFGNF